MSSLFEFEIISTWNFALSSPLIEKLTKVLFICHFTGVNVHTSTIMTVCILLGKQRKIDTIILVRIIIFVCSVTVIVPTVYTGIKRNINETHITGVTESGKYQMSGNVTMNNNF